MRSGRSLPGTAPVAAFPLGGVGTGNVSVDARGNLRDWEIFNSPGKGNDLPYSFFALHASWESGSATRVLEAERPAPHESSHGYYPGDVVGLPRLAASTMTGEYPLLGISFEDESLPLDVRLEAFTPLLPLDAADSGIPAAVLRYVVRNTSNVPVEVSVAGSLANATGLKGYELFFFPRQNGSPFNRLRQQDELVGIDLRTDLPSDDLTYGSMALLARGNEGEVTAKPEWMHGYWWDGIQDFWDDFSADGRLDLESRAGGEAGPLTAPSTLRVGSIAISTTLAPGAEHAFEFVLAWHFPNRPKAWNGHIFPIEPTDEIVRNFYATRFEDAWAAGAYVFAELERLESATRRFHDALHDTTLPASVVDALAANIVVTRSTTCFRLEDGTFLGWEGSFDKRGSCEGTCTHVWNYAQTLAHLFPELERSMRRVEFLLETDDDGRMSFRTNRVFDQARWDVIPAVDGQLGTIVRLYREWRISGDDAFLRELWPSAARALDFAFGYWDSDGDDVLDAQQHNTYDIEFHGPNSLANSLFYAALAAGEQMAAHVGDGERAERYRVARERGSRRMDELLWGGEYYEQALDDLDAYRYQYGSGCLSDQVFGQLLAHTVGLGYILPEEHVRSAVGAIYRHNFRSELTGHENVQRTFALGHEAGLVLCSWPKGGRPRLPFVYSQEIWTGIEYQVAAHLIYEGFVDEGLALVAAVRGRHDGYNRNPWNEVECGNHYVRSMASWAVLLAASGFVPDNVSGTLTFAPAFDSHEFRSFFAAGSGWGSFSQTRDDRGMRVELRVDGGEVDLRRLRLDVPDGLHLAHASLDGTTLNAALDRVGQGLAELALDGATLREGSTLTCCFESERSR